MMCVLQILKQITASRNLTLLKSQIHNFCSDLLLRDLHSFLSKFDTNVDVQFSPQKRLTLSKNEKLLRTTCKG